MRAELVAALAAAHLVLGPAAVELRAAFTESQERGVSEQKRDDPSLGIDGELLNCFALRGFNNRLHWIKREPYAEFAHFDGVCAVSARKLCRQRPPRFLYK